MAGPAWNPNAMAQGLRDYASRTFSLDPQPEQSLPEMGVEAVAGFIPGVGQAMAGRDWERARRANDPAGMAMAGASLAPWGRMGKALKSGVFGGKSSKGADLSKLKKAEEEFYDPRRGMSEQDTRTSIWQKHGWEPEAGGKWIYEIPDQGMSLRKPRFEMGGTKFWDEDVKSAIHHPKLFEAHADIGDMPFHGSMDPKLDIGGSYQGLRGGRIDVTGNIAKDFMSSSIHEINHGLQHKNLLEGGGDPDRYLNAIIETNHATHAPQKVSDVHKANEMYLHRAGEAYSRAAEARWLRSPESNLMTPPSQTLREMGYPIEKLLLKDDISDIIMGRKLWEPPPQKPGRQIDQEVLATLLRRLGEMP